MRSNQTMESRSTGSKRATGTALRAAQLALGLALGSLTDSIPAQITPAEPALETPQPQVPLPEVEPLRPKLTGEGRYRGSYSESTCRELFRACDSNSDDRLDIFETSDSFDVIPSPKDLDGFSRIDTDRNGYVTWTEFDQRFKKGLQHGGTFVVRTVRQFVLPEPPPQPLTPLQKFIRLHDKDEDGRLSTTEIADLLKASGLPELLTGVLMQSDLDKSGNIDETEIAPWYAEVYQSSSAAKLDENRATATGLTQPWADADSDSDDTISDKELTTLLRRLDPGLLRWTTSLRSALDANKDGKLSSKELKKANPADQEKPSKTGAKKKPAASAGKKATNTPQR